MTAKPAVVSGVEPTEAAVDAAVVARGLAVRRGGRQVLHGLDFTLPTGSVTGLLGPSGSGKTTVMRCVVGVQANVTGSVRVLGLPAGTPELRQRIGYVTQAPSVYPDLTVADNVRYFAALRGSGPAAVRSVLADVGLSDRRNSLVRELSGGQQARVSLACALLGPPELLVLDEPTVGLDPVLRRDLWGLFGELARRGTTLLVSSHVMDEAGHCERLLLLREGRLVAEDTPDGIRGRTGTQDLAEAFLYLIEHADTGGRPGPQPPPLGEPPHRTASLAVEQDDPVVVQADHPTERAAGRPAGHSGHGTDRAPTDRATGSVGGRTPARVRATLATARRVLGQLRHDARTVVMLLVAPCLLLTLFRYVFDAFPVVFDRVGLPMLGIFPLIVMFLITSVTMVRERSSGTLERLLTTPMAKLDLLAGYALAFGAVALVQACVASAVALGPLGLDVASGVGTVLVLAVVNALLGMAMGLFLSAFATTEFQAVQFMPAFLLPQVLLCGLLTPRQAMVDWLRWLSDVMPLSYAVDALSAAGSSATVTAGIVQDGLVVAGCALLALAGGAATLRRRSP